MKRVVCDSMTPGKKLDLLLYLVLGKGASVASEVDGFNAKRVYSL